MQIHDQRQQWQVQGVWSLHLPLRPRARLFPLVPRPLLGLLARVLGLFLGVPRASTCWMPQPAIRDLC